jgi:hypothetical protein
VEQAAGVKILNSREPNQAWGLFNVSLERVDAPKAYEFLWTKYRIITAAIKRDDYQGLRVTPNVYTTLEEVDTFAARSRICSRIRRPRRPRTTKARKREAPQRVYLLGCLFEVRGCMSCGRLSRM